LLKRPATTSIGAQQEHGREQVPLDLEPRVAAVVERLADDGVAGADHHGGQHEPGDGPADARVQRIDQS
jgi:hypothetical protein